MHYNTRTQRRATSLLHAHDRVTSLEQPFGAAQPSWSSLGAGLKMGVRGGVGALCTRWHDRGLRRGAWASSRSRHITAPNDYYIVNDADCISDCCDAMFLARLPRCSVAPARCALRCGFPRTPSCVRVRHLSTAPLKPSSLTARIVARPTALAQQQPWRLGSTGVRARLLSTPAEPAGGQATSALRAAANWAVENRTVVAVLVGGSPRASGPLALLPR